MERRFKYTRDKKVRKLSRIWTGVGVLAFASLFLFIGDGYIRVWAIVILLAILLLFILSIPRYIKVDDDALEIHCVVELTRILIRDISVIRKVTRADIGALSVILGSWGFFGYYGYYYNWRHWEMFKVYASEWANFVVIEDIYEQKYLVSCREADSLIETVMQAKLEQAGDESDPDFEDEE